MPSELSYEDVMSAQPSADPKEMSYEEVMGGSNENQDLTPESSQALAELFGPTPTTTPAPPSQPGILEKWGFDPKVAADARASIIPRLKDFWDKHVTWGDTTAAREEQSLARFYPEAEKEKIYQTGKRFITEAHPPAEVNPLYWYGRGVEELGKATGVHGLEIAGGAYKGVGEAEVKFATPMNVGISAVAPEGKIAEAVLGGTFLGQAIAGTPAGWKALKQAWDKRDYEKVAEIGASMGASYLPGLGLLSLMGVKAPPGPEPETIESTPMKMSRDQFTEAAQLRLEELLQKDRLTPVEEAEKNTMIEHLSEGGNVEDLAPKMGVEISEPKAPQPIEAQIGGEPDASRIGSTEEVPLRDEGTGVGEEAPLRQQGEVAPESPQPGPTGETVAAAPPEGSHGQAVEPGEVLFPTDDLNFRGGEKTKWSDVKGVKKKVNDQGKTVYAIRYGPKGEYLGYSENPVWETHDNFGKGFGEEVPVEEEVPQETQGQKAGVLEPSPEPVAATEEVAEPEAAAPATPQQEKGWKPKKKSGPIFDNFANSSAHPVSTAVHEMGGLISKSQAIQKGIYEGNEALWDGAAPFAHPTHNKIYRPEGELPDVIAQNLYEDGLLKESSVDDLWEALHKESKSARAEHQEQRRIDAEVKQAEQQHKDFISAQENFYKKHASESKVTPTVEWKDLGIGDKVVVDGSELTVKEINPDDLAVVLDGGKRFGIQEVREGENIFGEHIPAPREDLEFAPPESGEEMLARQKKEAESNAKVQAEAEKKAKVKTGWAQKKTGDTGDLGQMDIAGAEAPQSELFNQAQKLRLRSEKEGGYVNAEIMKEAIDYGRKLYGKAKDFTSWAGEMVRNLGSAIRDHLQGIWRSITGQNILPHARERGAVPLPQRKRGEGPRTTQERQLDVFKAEARQKGIPPTAKMYEYWKKHMESLPEQGETIQQHEARTPELEVNKANYDYALANNQIMAASQIKRAALKRGLSFDAPKAPVTKPKLKTTEVVESKPGEITVKNAVTGKTNSFVLPPERVPQQINYHLGKGDTILAAPKGSLQEAGRQLREGGPLPSQRPGGAEKWDPEKDEGIPVVNDENGGTKEPPPPGSAFGTPPDGYDPGKYWAQNVFTKLRDYWEHFIPRDRKMLAEDGIKGGRFIIAHQHMLDRARDNFLDTIADPAYKTVMDNKHDADGFVDAEFDAISHYQSLLETGLHPDAAWEEAIMNSPIRSIFEEEKRMQPVENEAADILGVPRPKKVEDPYLPRITNEDGKNIVRLGYQEPGVGGQIRKSIGIFDTTRTHRTMKEGIAKGTQYDSPVKAWLMRKKVSALLRATADTVKELLDNECLYESERAAKAGSKDGKTAYKITGLGGKDYWVASRQQAKFMEHNFNNPKSQWSMMNRFLNQYVRNPNLINPLPHITKNMFFKLALARFNNFWMKKDIASFKEYSEPEMIDKFGELVGWPKSHLRIPQLMARASEGMWVKQFAPEGTRARAAQEAGLWAEHAIKKVLRVNEFSQKWIFQKADPAMRYAVWRSYVRKGMSPEEAAGHTWLDLVRYDANSGGINFWKNIPLNFFVPWRMGTYVTLFKAMRNHPVGTMVMIGALEYAREVVQRKTLTWTHLPIDYLEAPLADAVEAFHKANQSVKLGKNPAKAYGGAMVDVGKVAATIGMFGPGGAQAPDSLIKTLQAFFSHGTAADRARAQNMFWGVSQIVNMPQEFMAAKRDGKWTEHFTKMFANFAFGTHSTIQYEPLRLGKYIPESWPGMAKSPAYKRAEYLRQKRENRGIKAENTYDLRHGVTRGFDQGPEEQQWSNLLRGAGAVKTRKPVTYPGH